jgi:glycosyltransferase involved in cell wall biosynthesis
MVNKKIKILFIGGTRYSQPLNPTQEKKMKALSEKLDVTCIGFNQEKGNLHFFQHADFYLISSKIINYVRQSYFLLFAFFKGLSLIKKESVQLVICQSPFEGISGVLLKKILKKTKLIIEIHGEWDKAPITYKRLNKKIKWISDYIGGWTIRNCDALRVISEAILDIFSDFKKKIFIFPAYTDIEMFLNTAEKKIISHRFIYVGQLVRLKGIDTIIEAVGILKQKGIKVEVLLIGKGEDINWFKKFIKKTGLKAEFMFIGFKNQKDVAELIKTSIALLIPSITEGFGRVIIEAFACSRSVIGSKVGGIPELIEADKTGLLVEPGNTEDLADKLIFALENPEDMKKMGEKGKEFVVNNFSTQKYVDNYYSMISNVLNI